MCTHNAPYPVCVLADEVMKKLLAPPSQRMASKKSIMVSFSGSELLSLRTSEPDAKKRLSNSESLSSDFAQGLTCRLRVKLRTEMISPSVTELKRRDVFVFVDHPGERLFRADAQVHGKAFVATFDLCGLVLCVWPTSPWGAALVP